MPVEIREMYIKVQVQDTSGSSGNPEPIGEASQHQINTIVAECVEQVLTILREKQER
jgi:hypothetical protein